MVSAGEEPGDAARPGRSACTCRSFISFSALSLSAVSASSSWEADSPVFRSSVSSEVSSVIWGGGSRTVGWGRCQGRLAQHCTPSQCQQGPTLLSRRSLLSRSSLRSFSTFSSLLFSCWISSCNRAGGEGGGRRKG